MAEQAYIDKFQFQYRFRWLDFVHTQSILTMRITTIRHDTRLPPPSRLELRPSGLLRRE